MGEDGAKRVVVNSVGREIRTLEEEPPTEGKRLQLTIDYDVQKAVEDGFEAIGLQRRGGRARSEQRRRARRSPAVPAYDPNAFAAGIDRATWASLNTDELRPLQDRAIQGRYSPGSTFKMAVALAGARGRHHHAGLPGALPGPRELLRPRLQVLALSKGGHGTIDLRHAIEQSCDVYFYTVGNMVGVDKINKWATRARPRREERHRSAERSAGARAVDRVEAREDAREVVRGRDDLGRHRPGRRSSVTPVSMAVYMATLANGGTRVTPHLLKAVDDGSGWKPVPPPPPQSQGRRSSRRSCRRSATGCGWWSMARGTGGRARIAGHDVVGQDRHGAGHLESRARRPPGKTDKDLRDNGWFVFFAPRDNPQIAGVVFVEHGVHGGNAAPVAHHILDTFFAKKEGRPLPPEAERSRRISNPSMAHKAADEPS